MKLFKTVNQAGGILSAILFLMMVGLVRNGIVGAPYYVVGCFFLAFAAIFLVTAFLLIFRSFIWHIYTKNIPTMIRHYIYAYVACYILLIILDHITMGTVSWGHNLLYALIAAMFEVYIHGYRLGFNLKKPVPESDADDV